MTCLNYDRTHSIHQSFQKSLDGDASALWRLKMLSGCHLSFFVWLWYDAFMRHNLCVRLRAAHVTAHASLFSRFSALLLGFWSFFEFNVPPIYAGYSLPFPLLFLLPPSAYFFEREVCLWFAFLGILFSSSTCLLNPASPRSSASTPRPFLEDSSSVVCVASVFRYIKVSSHGSWS